MQGNGTKWVTLSNLNFFFFLCWKIICYVSRDYDLSINNSIEKVSEWLSGWMSKHAWLIEWRAWVSEWVDEWVSGIIQPYTKTWQKMDHAVWAKNLNSTRKHKLNFPQVHTCHKLWTEICEMRQIFKWDLIKFCEIFTKITLKLPHSSQKPLFICTWCKKLVKKTTKFDLYLFPHKMCCKMVWKFCEIW